MPDITKQVETRYVDKTGQPVEKPEICGLPNPARPGMTCEISKTHDGWCQFIQVFGAGDPRSTKMRRVAGQRVVYKTHRWPKEEKVHDAAAP